MVSLPRKLKYICFGMHLLVKRSLADWLAQSWATTSSGGTWTKTGSMWQELRGFTLRPNTFRLLVLALVLSTLSASVPRTSTVGAHSVPSWLYLQRLSQVFQKTHQAAKKERLAYYDGRFRLSMDQTLSSTKLRFRHLHYNLARQLIAMVQTLEWLTQDSASYLTLGLGNNHLACNSVMKFCSLLERGTQLDGVYSQSLP
jgi:hypothetical protein